MFFQAIIYVLILVGFAYLAWRSIIKPILESAGVEVDEEEVITTTHTERLEKTKREHEEALLSVNAVNEEKHLKSELKDITEKIKDAERQIEDTEDETRSTGLYWRTTGKNQDFNKNKGSNKPTD